MNLINQVVAHKRFGEGKIIALEGKYVRVQFPDKERIIDFPGAFESFLRCEDAELQVEIEGLIAEKKAADARMKAEAHEAKLRAIEEAKRQAEEAKQVSSKSQNTQSRKSNENNLVFKCNFCDGGCSEQCIGYKGVCTDEQIRYNIEKKRHSWCMNPDSPCCQYLQGKLTREELDALNDSSGFICYESRMLTAWTAVAGEDLDENGGVHQGRRIQDAASDSLAVLTTRMPGASEEDRIIFGVFVTGQAVEGDEADSGYVVAKDEYKIELTPDEAAKIKFWHYHKNSNGGARWGQGLYRYLKDTVAARILADIAKIKTGDEKAHAQTVLEYYCGLKGIDPNTIPAANGAI